MDEKERIERIMLKEEMNSAVFAAEIGIQGSTLSHILNGRNNPSLDVLKKILNRFRTVSSDWLILGIGSMYRTEKQSQAPTLFDSVDENISKPITSDVNTSEKNPSSLVTIQQKIAAASELSTQISSEAIPQALIPPTEVSSKLVRKIIIYYTDNTFQEFESK